MKKALDVEILGQKLTISSDAEETYMLKVAGYVDEKMQALSRAQKPVNKSNIAMLAALNIADEYHLLKRKYDAIANDLNLRTRNIAGALDEVLQDTKRAG